jgi:hypothetical protein
MTSSSAVIAFDAEGRPTAIETEPYDDGGVEILVGLWSKRYPDVRVLTVDAALELWRGYYQPHKLVIP